MQVHNQQNICFIHKNMKYMDYNRNARIWQFDLYEMAWHQPHTSIATLMQLSSMVLWTKIQ